MGKSFMPVVLLVLCTAAGYSQQRLFDQPVQLKYCSVSVEANPFIATTIVEMEFYNPHNEEVEAYQAFELNRGQVITDFQLDLNGKYREGSIEERWKAVRAYSAIVGKRVDPAILQMDWQNHYSLRIYPVPAKSSRKIKFTITQMMTEEGTKLRYDLPLQFTGNTGLFKLDIRVNRSGSLPYGNKGFLEGQLFNAKENEAVFTKEIRDVVLNKPVSFSINQFANEPKICIRKYNNEARFLFRTLPDVPRYYHSQAKQVMVYWDVSRSAEDRDLVKEVDFLESYVTMNRPEKITIVTFNHQIRGTMEFIPGRDQFSMLRKYLLNQTFAGGTSLGNLDFRNIQADLILLFSDGVNTIGNALPRSGTVKTICIMSGRSGNYTALNTIVGRSGGSIINLYFQKTMASVKEVDSAENFLFRFSASHIKLNEELPIVIGNSILLSGTISQPDNLQLIYGNNGRISKTETYFLSPDESCDETVYEKMQLLKSYDSILYGPGSHSYYNWQNLIVFGLKERVVTPQTSFLVLERVEDYIKYNIAPPKDLEEKCAEMNYVYRPEFKVRALKTFTEQESLQKTVEAYNARIRWWDASQQPIDLSKPVELTRNMDVADKPAPAAANPGNGFATVTGINAGGPSELKEVVVTSAFGIKRAARSTSSNVQLVYAEQLNTVGTQNLNDALAGKVAGVQVQSQSGAKLGAATLVRLRGENSFVAGRQPLYVVDGTVISDPGDININDVDNVTVLQGPAAAALFGSEGANGAIVVSMKKARRNYAYPSWAEYKLSSAPDEDYVTEMAKAADYDLWDTFLELEKEHKKDVGFYFEMADIFFERGKKEKADDLLIEAVELAKGSSNARILAGYLYEKWKAFDKAIGMYKAVLELDAENMAVKRDMALAYYQKGDPAEAVRILYAILGFQSRWGAYYSGIGEIALAEMNAMIIRHKGEFDISYINPNLIRALPVDVRITLASNYGYLYDIKVQEPDGKQCSAYTYPNNAQGRMINGYNYYDGNVCEYINKKTAGGEYSIKVDAYNYNSYKEEAPQFVRVVLFRNFQKANMQLEVKLYDLENQYGVVELDKERW